MIEQLKADFQTERDDVKVAVSDLDDKVQERTALLMEETFMWKIQGCGHIPAPSV